MDTTVELKLLVGLGNPGPRYALTRHNTGWRVSELLLESSAPSAIAAFWQPGNGELYWLTVGHRSCLLLKPLTFMNLSGEAVVRVTEHFGLSPREMLVVSDDLDLPAGQLRLRRNGSSGGHRGLASIAQHLQTTEFPRLRVGIGRPEPGSSASIVDYVLAPWVSASDDLPPLPLRHAAEVVRALADSSFEEAVRCAGHAIPGGQVQCQTAHQEKAESVQV